MVCMAIVTGNVVGIGVFLTPAEVARAASTELQFLGYWVLGALVALAGALVTAELSTAFPQNGGYTIWVQAAFGPFWAVQESYWSWVSGVVDNALYPILLYNTVDKLSRGAPWDPSAAPSDAPSAASSMAAMVLSSSAAGGAPMSAAAAAPDGDEMVTLNVSPPL